MLIKEIDISAIKHNAIAIKRIAGKRKVCAVVKADAYGFGIETMVVLLNGLVDYFAVASLGEAKKVAALTNKQILVLTPVGNVISSKNVCYTVSSLEGIKQLEKIASDQNRKIGVHIKVDSGMGRLGFNNKIDFIMAVAYVKNSKFLSLKGVFTHFASSDKTNLKRQNNQFRAFLKLVKLPKKCLIHSASSFALLSDYKTAGNMVRCGLAFYGGTDKKGLKPIFKAYAHVVEVKTLNTGDKVGYDGTFIAPKKMQVAVVDCGYFDGINRLLSQNKKHKNYFYINNKACKVLGRISMNLISINVSNANVSVYDRAYLIRNFSDVKRIAKNSGTIIYETFTSLKNTTQKWVYGSIKTS